MHPLAQQHLRHSALPTLFCPGCGNGTILNAMVHALTKLPADTLSYVSGIGCSSWIPVFLNADVIHSLHGRAIAVATGLKLAQPHRKVVVFTGDGDCLGIGGNHFIHAARRDLDLTVVMVNNFIYGMTGGQASPTTPRGARTKTTPNGSTEAPLDGVALAQAAGASFVAKETSTRPRALTRVLVEAIRHTGFSYVEVITQCPTQTGRTVFGNASPSHLFRTIHERVGKTIKVGILHRNQLEQHPSTSGENT